MVGIWCLLNDSKFIALLCILSSSVFGLTVSLVSELHNILFMVNAFNFIKSTAFHKFAGYHC